MTEPALEAPGPDALPDGVLETLRTVSTSTIATQLYKRGFRQPQLLGVKPLSEVVDGFVGEAFTMRFIPMREDVDGLDAYRSGNTLQWEAFESLQPGQVLVVDSYRSATAASGGDMLMTRAWKRGAAAVVTDGGLRDGHVLATLEQLEAYVSTKIHAGEPLWGNYPPGEQRKAEYAASLAGADADSALRQPRTVARQQVAERAVRRPAGQATGTGEMTTTEEGVR